MTGGTASGSRRAGVGVIKSTGRPGRGRSMTTVALGGRRNVCRCLGLGILRQVTTAVTTRTLPIEPRVIHSRWRPRNETAGVTGVALNHRRNMATGLTEGIYRNKSTAVTGRTLTSRYTVIHLCRAERYEVGMAGVACRRCRYVIGRLAQA